MIKKILPLLCPPGNGVFTVNTARERREELHKLLFSTVLEKEVKKAWKESLQNIKKNPEHPLLLGIASDCGGGIQRGANWGPLFLRQSLYELSGESFQDQIIDLGDIRVIPHLLHDKYLNKKTIRSCREALYGDENNELPVSPLSMAEYVLEQIYKENPSSKILTLGGDHSTSYPPVRTYLKAAKKRKKKAAIIHFDAHTDLLKDRLGIDLCFGSWCTHILDDLPSPDHLIQVGIRSSGKERNHWEKTFGVQQIWNTEFFKKGPKKLSEEILKNLHAKNVDELYVSFDIDALDETEVSATGTPEPDGLKTHDCLMLMRLLAKEIPIRGADLMEVAPFLNMPTREAKVNPEPNSTLMCSEAILNFFIEALSKPNTKIV